MNKYQLDLTIDGARIQHTHTTGKTSSELATYLSRNFLDRNRVCLTSDDICLAIDFSELKMFKVNITKIEG